MRKRKHKRGAFRTSGKSKKCSLCFVMPSFKRFYMEKRKKAIQRRKNGAKLLQLAMISCSYNFIKLSMCICNFNVAVRISINPAGFFIAFSILKRYF